VNKVGDGAEAQVIFSNIARVSTQRGVAALTFAGYVPHDEDMRRAARACRPVVGCFPSAASAKAFRALAGDMMHWPAPDEAPGLGLFVQQLLHLTTTRALSALHAR
jgi:flagellar biosynthesis protein FlhG